MLLSWPGLLILFGAGGDVISNLDLNRNLLKGGNL